MNALWVIALMTGVSLIPAFSSGDDPVDETDDPMSPTDPTDLLDPTDPTDPSDPMSDDTVEGTADDETVTATGSQTINAGEGGDRLITGDTASGAVLNGEAGNDTLTDGGENVTLNGGAGNDLFSGGDATGAVMNGGEGDDTFQLDGSGGVVVNGDAGDDLIETLVDSQNMTLNGGDGADEITVGGRDAVVHGDAGDDVINVEGAAEAVFGDAGNDTITASHGERGGGTPISGGDGDDVIILRDATPELGAASTAASGDAGDDRFDVEVLLGSDSASVADVLTGGTGADSFELTFVDGSATAGGDLGVVSRITDFDSAEDALVIDTTDLGARLEAGDARELGGVTITEEDGNTLITLQLTGMDESDAGSAVIQLDGVTGFETEDITFVS